MALKTSQKGIDLIKGYEGCVLTAYKPVKTEQYWTIGYGHYGPDVKQGMRITQSQAEAYLRADLDKFEKAVNSYDNIYHWKQAQFDALVSFAYNCGAGNLKSLLNGGKRTIAEISAKITAYDKAGGKALAGLTRRRKEEKALFDSAGAAGNAPTPNTNTTPPAGNKKTVEEIAKEVIAGKYGNGHAQRRAQIEALGYDYEEVRRAVNKLCK